MTQTQELGEALPFVEVEDRGEVIANYAGEDFQAWVIKTPAGTYDLIVFDYVVNEGTEAFPRLSLALARFALLASCAEASWKVGFALPPAEFPAAFDRFVNDTLQ